jgi:hypothetical protein
MREKVTASADTGRSVIAGLDSSLGIEFHFEAQNRIRAELVAFDADHRNIKLETAEAGLATAGEIIQRLQENQCQVRERVRNAHKHPEGHQLHVVEVLPLPAYAVASAEKPKHQQMGGEL